MEKKLRSPDRSGLKPEASGFEPDRHGSLPDAAGCQPDPSGFDPDCSGFYPESNFIWMMVIASRNYRITWALNLILAKNRSFEPAMKPKLLLGLALVLSGGLPHKQIFGDKKYG